MKIMVVDQMDDVEDKENYLLNILNEQEFAELVRQRKSDPSQELFLKSGYRQEKFQTEEEIKKAN